MPIVLSFFACVFVIVTEFSWGFGLLAAVLALAVLHSLLWGVSGVRPSVTVWRHVLFAAAYAVVHAAIRCPRPGAYPPLVIADGLWCASLMVAVAAVACLIMAKRRRP